MIGKSFSFYFLSNNVFLKKFKIYLWLMSSWCRRETAPIENYISCDFLKKAYL